MTSRDALCSCGQLHLTAEGDPIRISMCHCLACQRRTGSAFAIQARFASTQVRIVGRHSDYVRTSDEGDERTFHFCPDCGATVFYTLSTVPDVVAVPIGAFCGAGLPATDRFGVRVSTASVANHDCRDGTPRLSLWCHREPQLKSGSSVSSHSRQIQSPRGFRALSAAGTIVTPQAEQIGGRSSSTPG